MLVVPNKVVGLSLTHPLRKCVCAEIGPVLGGFPFGFSFITAKEGTIKTHIHRQKKQTQNTHKHGTRAASHLAGPCHFEDEVAYLDDALKPQALDALAEYFRQAGRSGSMVGCRGAASEITIQLSWECVCVFFFFFWGGGHDFDHFWVSMSETGVVHFSLPLGR